MIIIRFDGVINLLKALAKAFLKTPVQTGFWELKDDIIAQPIIKTGVVTELLMRRTKVTR